jgi:hypothetical protein
VSGSTILTEPSSSWRWRTARTSAPRAVESRNETAARSTTTVRGRLPPRGAIDIRDGIGVELA